jgi:osmotically-inducible protein OsmY
MDGSIRRELNARIANDVTLENRSINFDVNQGVVTIKGEVASDAERQKVGELARATPNVRDIVNALTLDSDTRRDSTAVPSPAPAPVR